MVFNINFYSIFSSLTQLSYLVLSSTCFENCDPKMNFKKLKIVFYQVVDKIEIQSLETIYNNNSELLPKQETSTMICKNSILFI